MFLVWTRLALGSSQVIEIGPLGEWKDVKARAANDSWAARVRLTACVLGHSWTY